MKFPDAPTDAVMTDTGFEHQRPISAADFARHRCAEFGLGLTVVRHPRRTYLGMVEQRGMFPSPPFRQCTSDLKRGPIDKFIRSLPHKWLPVFDQTLSDVLAWHWRNAIRLHPVYVPEYHKDGTTGGYLRRLSCRVCIFSTDADLAAIHLHDHPAFDAVADLERKMKVTMRPGASLIQIVEAHSSASTEEARQQSFCF